MMGRHLYRAHAKAGADLFDIRWLDEICIITAADIWTRDIRAMSGCVI